MSENGFSLTGIFSYKSIIVDLRKPVFSHVLQGVTFKGLKKSSCIHVFMYCTFIFEFPQEIVKKKYCNGII